MFTVFTVTCINHCDFFYCSPITGLSADMHNVLSIAGPVTFFSGIIIAGLRYPRAKEEFLRSSERGLVKFQRQNLRIARVSINSKLYLCLIFFLLDTAVHNKPNDF